MKRGVAALKKLARFALVELGGGKRKAVSSRLKGEGATGVAVSSGWYVVGARINFSGKNL